MWTPDRRPTDPAERDRTCARRSPAHGGGSRFAAYAIVTGGVAIIGALKNRDDRGWWLVLLLGIVSVAAGVIAIFYPAITALALIIVIGVNAFFSGLLDIAMAIRLRKEIEGEWLLGLAGIVSILFGAFVIILPGAGALALVWLIAVYAMATGILFMVLGFRLRSSRHDLLHTPGASAGWEPGPQGDGAGRR